MREAELEAQEKRLVDTYYKEVNQSYGLRPDSIDPAIWISLLYPWILPGWSAMSLGDRKSPISNTKSRRCGFILQCFLIASDATGDVKGEAIAPSILARNCFWASNPVPVLRIFDRVWACAPRIAQTYVRIESLRRSTFACVEPSYLSRTNIVQAPEISRLCRMTSFGWKNGPCATCACLYAPGGVA